MAAPRLLLLQARDAGDPAREHEHDAFADKLGLDPEVLVPHDLLSGAPEPAVLDRHDAVLVGGSGEYYVSKGNLPHAEAFADFLREVVERGVPMFASCFGFQCLTDALGGEIVHDPEHAEVGAFDLELTPEGLDDPLFGELPTAFRAQLGRKDRASRLPAEAVPLARSEAAPFQALRVQDRPVWATQFHPELDQRDNLRRYELYLEAYTDGLDEAARRRALERFGPSSPEVPRLLPRFLDLVLD